MERRDAGGRLLHPNLQRRLGKAGGYSVWLRHDAFDINQHVTLAPVHYQNRLLTSRNMQVTILRSSCLTDPPPCCGAFMRW